MHNFSAYNPGPHPKSNIAFLSLIILSKKTIVLLILPMFLDAPSLL